MNQRDKLKYLSIIVEKWADPMEPPNTSGIYGQTNIGISTIDTAITTWSIPEQFRDRAVKSVKLLVSVATEGSLLAQAFTFDIEAGTSLTTLLIVVAKVYSPLDPKLPYVVTYVTINTNAQLTQQQSVYYTKRCFNCADCVWLWACCCKYDENWAPRGHTPDELKVVKQKMTADQYAWFNRQNIPVNISTKLNERTPLNDDLTEAIENYLSSKPAQDEMLALYNDATIIAIQRNVGLLKLSSQMLTLKRIERKNILTVLNTVAEDYGFDNIYSNSTFAQEIGSSRFSFENLFTSQLGPAERDLAIKYVWILGQMMDNSTYTLRIFFVNITSRTFINTILPNNTNVNNTQLNITRTSILTALGEFINQNLPTLITPWKQKTTLIVLNMLRFISAGILVPKTFRMVSSFSPEVIEPNNHQNSISIHQSPRIIDTIIALSGSITGFTTAIKGLINLFSSSSSTTISRIVRLGFNYFHQRATTLKAIDMPRNRAEEFMNAVIMDYNLPSKSSFMLALTYSNDFRWDQINYIHSPSMNGEYNSVTLFKNSDSIKSTSSFFIININASWTLAPDLLFITKKSSTFGGLFSSTSQSIQEVPHMLTFDEVALLQQFFMIIAIGNMAPILGINFTYPDLHP